VRHKLSSNALEKVDRTFSQPLGIPLATQRLSHHVTRNETAGSVWRQANKDILVDSVQCRFVRFHSNSQAIWSKIWLTGFE